jgi:hypothetical protein
MKGMAIMITKELKLSMISLGTPLAVSIVLRKLAASPMSRY